VDGAVIVTHPWLSEIAPRLYCQTFPKLVDNDAELDVFLEALEALVDAQRGPFAWVVMADALMQSSAKQRKTFAAAEARMKEQDARFCAGTAFVLTSAIARGAVTAVYWLSPPVYPYAIRSTREAAIAWATAQLGQRDDEVGQSSQRVPGDRSPR
jgi:hypothetical protein